MKIAVLIRPEGKPDDEVGCVILSDKQFAGSIAKKAVWTKFAQSYAPPGVTVQYPGNGFVEACESAGYRVAIVTAEASE